MREKIQQLLQAAILAPSGDNCQPWQFTLQGDELTLRLIPERDTSLYSWGNRPSYVSHGALIENLVIAAEALGVNLEMALFPDPLDPTVTARMTIKEGVPQKHPLYEAIFHRCTNRKPYKLVDKWPEGLLAQIEECAKNSASSIQIRIITDKEKKEQFSQAASLNERILFENEEMHRFFYEHIRWNAEEEAKMLSGFRPENLEIPLPVLPLFRAARRWGVTKFLQKIGFPKKLAETNARVYSQASAVGGVIIPDASARSFCEAGRLFQRIWLTVTARGWSLQPLTGIMFLMMSTMHNRDGDALNTTHQLLISEAYHNARNVLGASEGSVLALGFRIGDGGQPSARTVRMPVDSVLKEETTVVLPRLSHIETVEK